MRPDFHFIAEMESRAAQLFDVGGNICDAQNDSVPTAWLLTMAAGHRTRARRPWSAEQKVKISERDVGKGGELLMLKFESKVLGVERDGATHVADLISNAVESWFQALGRSSGVRFVGRCSE